ncbi:MAG TPA: 1,4-dihydroxy-2-naphthoate polyprenyltransferase [Acidimicrobiia bacterium]|nr:1,4-dihydroxy-2-naphthoate polyprenyltransferase [Acidimicrobiia bacterium]
MSSARAWLQGARPRTLGAAVAPVVVGTACASTERDVLWGRAAAALVVALALQVGVNYANDYSDGVRGTDANRRGPLRLVASGAASAAAVRRAAFLAFGVAAVVGGWLALVVDARLLVIGAAAIAAAWLYTGGPKPYGYVGLGEVMVLVFFGFVATVGSAYVQLESVPGTAWWGALVAGLPAVSILLANNIRDVETDRVAGKHTLAVRIGAPRARALSGVCLAGSLVGVVGIAFTHASALVALLAAPLAVRPWRLVATRDDAPSLIAALVATGRFQLALAALLAIGLAFA